MGRNLSHLQCILPIDRIQNEKCRNIRSDIKYLRLAAGPRPFVCNVLDWMDLLHTGASPTRTISRSILGLCVTSLDCALSVSRQAPRNSKVAARTVWYDNLHPIQSCALLSVGPGNIVRIAPNELSISDPEAIKIIYGVNSGFIKVS